MIYCPECGSANSEGSRFCSECGHELGMQKGIEDAAFAGTSSSPAPETPSEPDVDEGPRLESSPDSEDDTPSWLRDLRSTLSTQPPEPAADAADDEEVPDWLKSLRAVPPRQPEGGADAFRVGEEEPGSKKLSGVVQAEEETLPEPPTEPLPPEAEDEQAVPPPISEPQEETGPDWLSELRPQGMGEHEPEPTPPASDSDDEVTEDWLADLRSSATEEMPTAPAPSTDARDEIVPDWLGELRPGAVAEGVEKEAEGPPHPSAPDWLGESETNQDEESAGPTTKSEVEEELPDWLVLAEPADEGEPLAPAEIPTWLMALKPRELESDQAPEKGKAPKAMEAAGADTGLLVGLHGTLAVEMAIAQPRPVTAKPSSQPLTPDSPQALIFADVVADTPDAELKEIEPPAERAWGKAIRWLIYFGLIIAVLVPLLLDRPLILRTMDSVPTEVSDLHREIEALANDAAVLVAFDYDPTTSDEMNLLADALIGHLMDRGMKLVAVSLLPAGPATAQEVLDNQAAGRPLYTQSVDQQYANLGYLPGQAAGVRLLNLSLETAFPQAFSGTPLAELEVLHGLSELQDFDLILELAATQDTLRWWIEQASNPSRVPLAAGVSASVEPLVQPYYMTEPKQVVGLLGGVPGVATYEALRSEQRAPTDATAARLDAQLIGHLVFILALVIGNFVYLLRPGSGR